MKPGQCGQSFLLQQILFFLLILVTACAREERSSIEVVAMHGLKTTGQLNSKVLKAPVFPVNCEESVCATLIKQRLDRLRISRVRTPKDNNDLPKAWSARLIPPLAEQFIAWGWQSVNHPLRTFVLYWGWINLLYEPSARSVHSGTCSVLSITWKRSTPME